MIITVFYTDSGTPKTGLSATIRIRKLSDDSLVVTDAAMSEVGDGFYKYDFSTYDEDIDYVFRTDAGVDTVDERYFSGNNDNQAVEERTTAIKTKTDNIDWTDITLIKNISEGRWHRTGSQLIFYKPDNTTEIVRFNLFQANGTSAGESDSVFERKKV